MKCIRDDVMWDKCGNFAKHLKVMTDFSSLTTVRLALSPQIRYLQGAGAVKARLVGQALRLVLAQTPSIVSIVLAT